MTLTLHCRTCGCPMNLDCDKDYPGSDPLGTAALVVCTPCFEKHKRQRRIEAWISKTCEKLMLGANGDIRQQLRKDMQTAAQKYGQVLCEIQKINRPPSTPDLAESLFNEPNRWPILLRQFRHSCRGGNVAEAAKSF